MRFLCLVVMLLASVAALNAANVIALCPTGGTGCSGTYSYSYVAEDTNTYNGTPVVLSAGNLESSWATPSFGAWVSIQNLIDLIPDGMTLMTPGEGTPPTPNDPLDPTNPNHTWTNPYYVNYLITFNVNLSQFDLPTLRIKGKWSADDGGYAGGGQQTGIFLNGTYVSGTEIPAFGTGSYSSLHAFDFGPTGLVNGTNTLGFVVQHADSHYDGVLVDELSLSDQVPEPASLLFVIGGAGLLFLLRRR